MVLYGLQSLTEDIAVSLANDMISLEYNTSLEPYNGGMIGPDLWHINPNKEIETLVEVKWHRQQGRMIKIDQMERISRLIDEIRPKRFILIDYTEDGYFVFLSPNAIMVNQSGIEILYHGIKWIKKVLDKYPQLRTKHQIQPPQQDTQSPALLQDRLIKVAQKYEHVRASEEFYFQKAVDLLDDLKMVEYGLFEVGKSSKRFGSRFHNNHYQRLADQWNNRGKVRPSQFVDYLKEHQAESIELYEFVSKFLTYIDRSAWNKNVWNEYDDKRYVAITGLYQTQLVDAFLQYALNDFAIKLERRNLNFYRAMEYLHRPSSIFNILSVKDKKSISTYFLGANYSGTAFDSELIKYFSSLRIPVTNPKNATALYTYIIYDDEIRSLWDKSRPKEIDDIKEVEVIEDEEGTEKHDKIPFHLDKVVDEDKLGREPVARAFVNLVKNDIFKKDLKHSFMVHLQGEWGTGKSSFLEFVKKHLNADKACNWVIVDYNAWQNQHISPPWWTLIDQVYRKSRSQLKWWNRPYFWLREISRRLRWYAGWEKVAAFVFTLVGVGAILYFGKDITDIFLEKSKESDLLNVGKLVGAVASVITIIYSLSKFIVTPMFVKSSNEAKAFVLRAADPMSNVVKHYSSLVNCINKINDKSREKWWKLKYKTQRQLAIFIDDIDRCNKEFIVELLEGIQTLFKSKRVLFIVAGDKKWITKSFGTTYSDFAKNGQEPNALGEKFLEKAFQLSLRLPQVSKEAKQDFWNHILGVEEKIDDNKIDDIDQLDEEIKEAIATELANTDEDIADPSYMNNLGERYNLGADVVSNTVIDAKNKDTEEIRHLLRSFHELISTNPRNIIRLANNYTMTRSTLIAERKPYEAEKLFRWLCLQTAYPLVTDLVPQLSTTEELFSKLKVIEGLDEEHCKKLVLDEENKRGGAMTLEEIKTILGQNA